MCRWSSSKGLFQQKNTRSLSLIHLCCKTRNNCINVIACRVVYRNNFLFVLCFVLCLFSQWVGDFSDRRLYNQNKTKYIVYTKDFNLLSVYWIWYLAEFSNECFERNLLKKYKVSSGLEPETSRVWSERDNHYTTKPMWQFHKGYHVLQCVTVSLCKYIMLKLGPTLSIGVIRSNVVYWSN